MSATEADTAELPAGTGRRRGSRRTRSVLLAAGATAVVVAGVVAGVAVSRGGSPARQGAYVTVQYESVDDYFKVYTNGNRPVVFNLPFGVAADASGIVYAADTLSHRIDRTHTPTAREQQLQGENGTVTVTAVEVLAGSGDAGWEDGSGVAARFRSPGGVAADANGNVYVADTENSRIRRIGADRTVTTVGGSDFDYPYGVAVDGSGNLYVADTGNNRIRKITPAGVVTTLAGGTAGFADGAGSAARFSAPHGVAVDGSGNVYVADTDNNRIRRITPTGVVTTLAGSGAAGFAEGTGTAAQFSGPGGLTVSRDGVVFVADTGNNRIRKITPAGVATTVAGSGVAGNRDVVNEPLTKAEFNQPYGIALLPSGSLVVADTFNGRVRSIVLNW